MGLLNRKSTNLLGLGWCSSCLALWVRRDVAGMIRPSTSVARNLRTLAVQALRQFRRGRCEHRLSGGCGAHFCASSLTLHASVFFVHSCLLYGLSASADTGVRSLYIAALTEPQPLDVVACHAQIVDKSAELSTGLPAFVCLRVPLTLESMFYSAKIALDTKMPRLRTRASC
jgi:hypothetical protein